MDTYLTGLVAQQEEEKRHISPCKYVHQGKATLGEFAIPGESSH